MQTATWHLVGSRPVVELFLIEPTTGRRVSRVLLADTGAGSQNGPFELVLDEDDCLLFSRKRGTAVPIAGAYSGLHATYLVRVAIPQLGFSRRVSAVAVHQTPPGLSGIACFGFLNRFSYGNFGDQTQFGLELP